ncbi:ISL3 family transposase [Clostridium transplantifaecale]|uniref:ISL3 family transposase n=1 Tax=Clostridium transplantifaecale TaxID=2479838 RepID=UPI001FAA46D0|nr:ISL3 family transposase [Clostridium transplantifaecale]
MMKYKELENCPLKFDENHFIYEWHDDGSTLHLYLKSRSHPCACPDCGALSSTLNSAYTRTLQDTPIRGKHTLLHVKSYKYKCTNPDCQRKVFVEPLPFARHSQTRTDALNAMILDAFLAGNAEGSSRRLAQIGVKVSGDSILRLGSRFQLPDDPEVTSIGVDEVAIRKGQTYATVIYNAQTHLPLALFPGSDGASLREWLLAHKKVNKVARDRASAYSEAIRLARPNCIQIADRFHLLQNLSTALSKLAKDEIPDHLYLKDGEILKKRPEKIWVERTIDPAKMASLHYDNACPLKTDGTELVFDSQFHRLSDAVRKKQDEAIKKKRTNPCRTGEVGPDGRKEDPPSDGRGPHEI